MVTKTNRCMNKYRFHGEQPIKLYNNRLSTIVFSDPLQDIAGFSGMLPDESVVDVFGKARGLGLVKNWGRSWGNHGRIGN